MARTIVTGSRYWAEPFLIWLDLNWQYEASHHDLTVVHGACCDRRGRLRGADRWADGWCALAIKAGLNVKVERYPAALFGPWPACGPLRNRHMVELGADLVLAYPLGESRGTRGCMKLATEAGIIVLNRGDP